MKLVDIEPKCKELVSLKHQLEIKLTELKRLESEIKEKTKEAQILEEIARLRGEKYKGEHESEELEKVRKEVENYKEKIKELEKEVYEGLKDVTFNIPLEIPKVNSRGMSIIKFEGEPCDYVVKFLASVLNTTAPLEIDNTQLHSDKIIVTNVKDPNDVVRRLKSLKDNIGRLARIALREKDPDIEKVVDYLHESNYREIWEAIKGRKRISYDDLFSELNLRTQREKKRVRNFFTNLEYALKEKFPFNRVSPGVYELSFFGSLVWKRYCEKYHVEKKTSVESVKIFDEKVEKKPEKTSLNQYLSNTDVKKVIYGKEVG